MYNVAMKVDGHMIDMALLAFCALLMFAIHKLTAKFVEVRVVSKDEIDPPHHC